MNVYEAAKERLKIIFDDFDNVLVAFSTGKDSGILLNLAYDYARENNLTHKLGFYYQDYEAVYKQFTEYAERMFEYVDVERKYWLCLPIRAACSVSMYEPSWIPWNPAEKDIWVRPIPKNKHVVNIDNAPFDFKIGTKGFDARIMFSEWYGEKYGKTAVLVGIRADESLTRRTIFTSRHRRYMHKKLNYSKVVSKNIVNFYPIFDWKTDDVWTANAKFGWDYNKIYDLYYMAGLSIDQMRTASPFHQSGQDNLKLYRVIDPDNWGKMTGRVNGCNFGSIYGGTSAMGWKKITKPEHFTWKEYAEFLIGTLPEKTKKKFLYHLQRLMDSWENNGYGRNPRVIKQMIKEGIELENTHEISKLCTKPDVYEIVKIKSGFPQDTSIPNFRICPNWKGVCITIMKNDWTLTYMGCSRTKGDEAKKKGALKKYKKLGDTKKLMA